MRKTGMFAAAILLATASQAFAIEAKEFVSKAAIGGLFEVQSSQLALERTEDQEIKDFAQEMVNDHGKANKGLQTVAEEEGLTVPAQLDEKHQQMLAKLGDAESGAFNDEYVSLQVEAHQNAVDLFETYSEDGDNAALKTFAQKNLPTLQRHLEDITAISKGETPTN